MALQQLKQSEPRPLPLRVVFWGIYDTGKPRVRIALRGLRENGVEVEECHAEIWRGVEDKTQIAGWRAKLARPLRWLLSYPALIFRYLRLPAHDAVIVGYMGHLDVLVLWPFAKWRGVPIIWDAFISLYNTIVEDRKLFGPRHPVALAVFCWEWLACRAASIVLLDTHAHASYFSDHYSIDPERTASIFVGAEPEAFPLGGKSPDNGSFKVLFYGQFIPLHGIETIIEAAWLMSGEPVQWVIIGQGQEAAKISTLLERRDLPNLQWVPWVEYQELKQWIQAADLCLGIFGATDKAGLVIPNKVFQILASGKPLVTRDSPAIRELLDADMPGVFLIPAADAEALAQAVRTAISRRLELAERVFHRDVAERITPQSIGSDFRKLIGRTCEKWGNRDR